MEMEKITVTELIEKICDDICDNYCKKPEEWAKAHNMEKIKNDPEYETFMNEVCESCPLNLLR